MSSYSADVAQNQKLMLAFFAAANGTVSFAQAASGMGWSDSMVKRYFYLLRDSELIERVAVRSRQQASTYALTDIGRGVAAGHGRSWAKQTSNVAQAPTFNTFDSGPYRPNLHIYYRNNGNRHISSHGVQC